MSRVKEQFFDTILRRQELAERQRPFLTWAKEKNPELYEAIREGRVRFKEKWLAPLPDNIRHVVPDDAPF